MTKNEAAAEITRIYRAQREHGQWMSMVNLGSHTDMTPEQIAEGMRHLARTEDGFNMAPESNQKMLDAMDHLYAVEFGCQQKHLFCWS